MMPRYIGSALSGYKKPESHNWVCNKTKCRHYKKHVWLDRRNKYTGCHKYVNTWQCLKFMGEDYYK